MNQSRAAMQSFIYEGVEDHYWILGNSKNPSFLLIPGFTGLHSDLLPTAHTLAKKYFVIIPELPGWGSSPRFKEELTLKNYARYLHALLESIDIHHLTVCGHCMGATLAIEFTYLYQSHVKQLFLISTPYLHGSFSFPLFLHLASLSKKSPKALKSLFFLWRSRVFAVPLSFVVLQTKSFNVKWKRVINMIINQPLQHEDAVEENWVSLIQFDYNKLKRIRIPTHLIHGKEDKLISLAQVTKLHVLIPHATLDVIDMAGHLPPAETPQTLANLIIEKY